MPATAACFSSIIAFFLAAAYLFIFKPNLSEPAFSYRGSHMGDALLFGYVFGGIVFIVIWTAFTLAQRIARQVEG